MNEQWIEGLKRTVAAQKKYGKMFCVYCESGDVPGCYCEVRTTFLVVEEKSK